MFIGIVGPTCSGKHEVANLLSIHYGFQQLGLRRDSGEGTTSTRSESKELTGSHPQKVFDTIEQMLDYVTLHWMGHFVTCDVHTVQGISILRKRPFFLLLSVESPMMMRYRRCVDRCNLLEAVPPTLVEFVESTDQDLYWTPAPAPTLPYFPTASNTLSQSDDLEDIVNAVDSTRGSPDRPHLVHNDNSQLLAPAYRLLSMSDLSILNHSSDLSTLWHALESLDITNPNLLRPSWDSYFMYLANLAARRSNCMKRRVGCVLVREKRVIATGYNGTPKNLTNCNDGGCSRCNAATPCGKGLDRCLWCAIKIVQVGVSEVVYSESYGMDDLTAEVFRNAGVVLRQHATTGIKLDQLS
ncbi:Deoxycytidine monophosphate (dCMP) deaminase [Mortierella antarctica]|nr:Deoxycytidine monophosphate (dCMP) deaminase [Mortierella antarctica]